ncbi:dehydrogenase/reductase SDR family member 4-like [Convolutriloba macropyga]|uniref:dehydrogenase/reductase SDR family member 4-like n=1 Tax=Convolutriloba macropyga TaxID=536237 RepID=UPI003F526A75
MALSGGRLLGKVSVITASTDGIGFAIAKRFLKEGSKVVISSRKQQNVDSALEKLVKVADELNIPPTNLHGLVCHVGKSEDRVILVDETVKKFGGLNILVSNAAVSPAFGNIYDVDEKAFDKIMDTNVQASFLLCKEALPHLRKAGNGSILFVSSIGAYLPLPGVGAYCVSKTALLGLTKNLATEFARFGIRVNCLAPGIIKTKFSEPLTGNEAATELYMKVIPMQRFGDPDEMGGPAVFLCSDDASYVTGETLMATGGINSRL